MQTGTDIIQIKGLRDGLLITLSSGEEWGALQDLLFTQIDERSAFFRGARLALDVGSQVLRVAEMSKLRDELSDRNVSLWAVVSESPKTVQTAQLLGLATRISKQRQERKSRPSVETSDDETALWVPRTLRSGTRIEFDGHIVVMGDVNPGAEIVAEGSILVWGRLRGAVYAGASLKEQQASPNSGATVSALEMKPTRLQIGSQIANLPKKVQVKSPQVISLKDGEFLVKPWQGK